jgi:hypothetical protein
MEDSDEEEVAEEEEEDDEEEDDEDKSKPIDLSDIFFLGGFDCINFTKPGVSSATSSSDLAWRLIGVSSITSMPFQIFLNFSFFKCGGLGGVWCGVAWHPNKSVSLTQVTGTWYSIILYTWYWYRTGLKFLVLGNFLNCRCGVAWFFEVDPGIPGHS